MAALDAFEKIARGLPADLVEAALVIAKDEYPDLDVESYLEQVQILCEGFDIFRGQETDPDRLLGLLGKFLFEDLGFRGNDFDYYDARNSYMNDVLDRRLGIPISLAVLFRAVASSAGLALEGINFPGHFYLLWQPESNRRVYVDVFHGGKPMNWIDCVAALGETAGPPLDESAFGPMPHRDVLLRMLRNLKGIYSRGDFDKCLNVQKRIARLCPESTDEQRDLGILLYHAGKPALAMQQLEKLVRQHPHCADQKSVREYLAMATKEAVALN